MYFIKYVIYTNIYICIYIQICSILDKFNYDITNKDSPTHPPTG